MLGSIIYYWLFVQKIWLIICSLLYFAIDINVKHVNPI